MNSRIAVTGATGMVGSHLVAELLKRGYDDIVLPVRSKERFGTLCATLRRAGFLEPECKPLHIIEVQLNDPIGLKEAFAGVDMVFHCAARVSLSGDNADELIETNVEMTTHVVNAAIECGVRRLIHTSSIATLGECAHGFIDENTALENLAGTSPYGISKFFCENRVWRAAEEGIEVVVVNPAIIIGAGNPDSGSGALVAFAASGTPFYTTGSIAYVDVDDVARAHADLAVCEKAAGERFILASQNLSYREFLTLSANIAGNRPPFIRADKIILQLAYRIESLMSKISHREAKLTKSAAASSLKKSLYDATKISRFIPDFKYTPIEKSLERVIGIYKNGG